MLGRFVCVYDQNYAIVIVTQQKNCQYNWPGKYSVNFSFKYTKLFWSETKQFWRTKILDKCSGAFVFVYDQNYALVIVTQPKKTGLQSF